MGPSKVRICPLMPMAEGASGAAPLGWKSAQKRSGLQGLFADIAIKIARLVALRVCDTEPFHIVCKLISNTSELSDRLIFPLEN